MSWHASQLTHSRGCSETDCRSKGHGCSRGTAHRSWHESLMSSSHPPQAGCTEVESHVTTSSAFVLSLSSPQLQLKLIPSATPWTLCFLFILFFKGQNPPTSHQRQALCSTQIQAPSLAWPPIGLLAKPQSGKCPSSVSASLSVKLLKTQTPQLGSSLEKAQAGPGLNPYTLE